MSFRTEYEKAAKKHGGNLVKPLLAALKNADAGKGSSKEAALYKTSLAELVKAMQSLRDFEKGAGGDQKKAATLFLKDLTKLQKDVEDAAAHADVDGKLKTAELSKDDLKDTQAIVKNMGQLNKELAKSVDQYSADKKALWSEIEKFGAARWDAMKDFAKEHGASISGFRSFPMCIPMMVEEVANAKPTFGKKPKKGSAQTAGANSKEAKDADKEEAEDQNKVQNEFIDFSQKAIAGELGKVNDAVTKVNRTLGGISHALEAMLKSTDKLSAEVKDLGGSAKGLQYQKVKVCLNSLRNKVDQAEDAASKLQKVVNKEKGLGRQDGDIRDAFADLPALASSDLEGAVGTVESGMKGLSKSA